MNELEQWQREVENRLTKVETKVDTVKEDIKEIKDFQSKIMWWLIGTMASSLLTLLTMVLNIIRK